MNDHPKKKTKMMVIICHKRRNKIDLLLQRQCYHFPSVTGSLKRQSRVGRPASLALKIEPSGNTSFLMTLSYDYAGHHCRNNMRNIIQRIYILRVSGKLNLNLFDSPHINWATAYCSCCTMELSCVMITLKMGKQR